MKKLRDNIGFFGRVASSAILAVRYRSSFVLHF